MIKKFDHNRKENFSAVAKIETDSRILDEVPCKIYLPERTNEKPQILINPTSELHQNIINYSNTIQLSIESKTSDGEVWREITASDIILHGSNAKLGRNGISEINIYGEPQNLCIWEAKDHNSEKWSNEIAFWISSSKLLSPITIPKVKANGEISHEQIHNTFIDIYGLAFIKFENRFRAKTQQNGDLVQWPHLVARAEFNTERPSADLINSIFLEKIDDLLLLASLASDRRIVCLGWEYSGNKNWALFHRGLYAFPESQDKSSDHDWNINADSTKEFLETSYKNFFKHENKLSLRSAIISIVPLKEQTIETSFINLFAGLESIVLDFRRKNDLEFIVKENEWKKLKKKIEASIRKIDDLGISKEQTNSICKKINELNRMSIREAFNIFCKKQQIYLDDLWPVFGSMDIIGLYEIRNRIVHGDPFPKTMISQLALAKTHLKIAITRIILSIIGWDVTRSRVSPASLYSTLNASSEKLSLAQKEIKEII